MKHFLTGLILMALSSQVVQAQMDIHCHMIPDSYLEAVKAHGLIPEDILSNNVKPIFNIQ